MWLDGKYIPINLKGHSKTVFCMKMQGSLLVSGGDDKKILVCLFFSQILHFNGFHAIIDLGAQKE
jgi:hypothetical protein